MTDDDHPPCGCRPRRTPPEVCPYHQGYDDGQTVAAELFRIALTELTQKENP